jgi:hypothetical protein
MTVYDEPVNKLIKNNFRNIKIVMQEQILIFSLVNQLLLFLFFIVDFYY